MADIIIYTTPTCPYCLKAKGLFDSLGVEYTEVNVLEHPKEREAMIQKHNWMTVPMIMINNEFIGGYDDLAALHAKGELEAKLNA